jgi:hypothetical protein
MSSQGYVHILIELLGIIILGFDRTNQPLVRLFSISQILEKTWYYNETVQQLFIGFKKAYDSVRGKVLYNILKEFTV